MFDFYGPMDYSLPGLHSWDSPGKTTGVGVAPCFQVNFLTEPNFHILQENQNAHFRFPGGETEHT